MKTLGGHPGTFTGEAFSGGGLESHPPLWMLTYSVAEANKRQKVISNFTSQGIHSLTLHSAVSLMVRRWRGAGQGHIKNLRK